MKLTAESLAQSTFALVVGIADYTASGLQPLPGAALQASRIADALCDPAGCALPPSNVVLLAGSAVTKAALLNCLEQFGPGEAHTSLFLYFAGHAIRDDLGLKLCTADYLPEVEESGCRSEELVTAFERLRCRAFFIVLDCCRSAGFAEHAPDFFRNLGESETRALLCASRESQLSYELPDGGGTLFSKHLIEIISGRSPAGAVPGKIYLGGLIESIQFGIEEDVETIFPTMPRQDLVVAQVGVRDPLLFFHRGAAAKNLTIDTGRFSRAYVVRIIRRASLALIATLSFVIGVYYAWLDGHMYAEVGQGRIRIYRGYPSLNSWKYPELMWDESAEEGDIEPESPLMRGEPMVATSSATFEPMLIAALSGEGLARRGIGPVLSHQVERGRSQSKTKWISTVSALHLIPTLGRESIDTIQRLEQHPNVEVRTRALLRLRSLSPDLTKPTLLGMYDYQEINVPRFLTTVSSPCDATLAAFIWGPVIGRPLQKFQSVALETASRLRCEPDLSAFRLRALETDITYQRSLGWFAASNESYHSALREVIDNFSTDPDPYFRAIGALLAASAFGAVNCPHSEPGRRDFDLPVANSNLMLDRTLRRDNARHLDDYYGALEALARAGHPLCNFSLEVLTDGTLRIHSGSVSVRVAEFMLGPLETELLIRVANERRDDRFVPLLRDIVESKQTPVSRAQAIDALRLLGNTYSSGGSGRLNLWGFGGLLEDSSNLVRASATRWVFKTDPEQVAGLLMSRIEKSSAVEIVDQFAGIRPTVEALRALEGRSSDGPVAPAVAAALAMFSSPGNACALLRDPHEDVRAATILGATARVEAHDLMEELDNCDALPVWVATRTRAALQRRSTIQRRIAAAPSPPTREAVALLIRESVAADGVYVPSEDAGLRAWLDWTIAARVGFDVR